MKRENGNSTTSNFRYNGSFTFWSKNGYFHKRVDILTTKYQLGVAVFVVLLYMFSDTYLFGC